MTMNNENEANAVTVHLRDNERQAVERLAAEKKMTVEQILRIALATYEAVDDYRMIHSDERMPWERHRGGFPRGAGLVE